MANQFARFVHTSAVSSIPHDPPITLASNCIRDYFGPGVQIVADCLQARGGLSTLSQIVSTINAKSKTKVSTEERSQIIKASNLRPTSDDGCPSIASVRASLLVLIQHSIVVVSKVTASGSRQKRTIYKYRYDPNRARILPRYPRFVEYTKKALKELGETAAALVEELLLQGRMRTIEAIVSTVEQLQQQKDVPRSDRYTYRQAVLETFRRLVVGGFIQEVAEIVDDNVDEAELGGAPPTKKRRIVDSDDTDDPAVVQLLQSGPYKMLPRDAVWRVNVKMFHDSLRAVSLGWLVAQRYGHRVQSAGAMVTAALKLEAYKEHAENNKDFESRTSFTTGSITRYLPKSVLQNLEKKPGGVVPNLHKSFSELSNFTNPKVVEVMEVTGGQNNDEAKFQISTRKLVQYLHDRIMHQVVLDSHGEVAARICSILRINGYLESDALAEAAMVPAKDTREVLHRLYREHYIDLFNINQGKSHNPNSMFYLWTLTKPRTLRKVTDNVCSALCNIRLRRQHEVEVGKDWIERAKEAGAADENENEADKLNYTRFCLGLERLDSAALQLDETLMVLMDY